MERSAGGWDVGERHANRETQDQAAGRLFGGRGGGGGLLVEGLVCGGFAEVV